ncbi:MAG: FGGY family carbohydrate kinase [Bacteroidia bacterium]|nr:FGGY family carbohydrate kinase [Bacteroidia bacterium]
MLLLGYDLGSSSVKAVLLEADSGLAVASAQFPPAEMPIHAPQPGWAEQSPEDWWACIREVTRILLTMPGADAHAIGAIGISYQMHGLVALDADGAPVRPAIIWCDSRAVATGAQAFEALGTTYALGHLLNSPGNFTASKLRWVQQHEPDTYARIRHIMLPGDYIAYRLTGEIRTTVTGLSEGILWDFAENRLATELLHLYEIDQTLIPARCPVMGEQGLLTPAAAAALGLPSGIPITYRAGDQPNNALSLQVLEPGEIAATAGTSGVVYGVTDRVQYDPQSRVNTFAHVNHGANTRLGVLLCLNGCGILNSWARRITGATSYPMMNEAAATITPGSEGLTILPFGNGAERILGNLNPQAAVLGLDLNRHTHGHLYRAVQEGIAFALAWGIGIMRETGLDPAVIRAGSANMFLSPVFRETLAAATGVPIALYETDGAAGAARGAGLGLGYYPDTATAFAGLRQAGLTEPDPRLTTALAGAYDRWREALTRQTGIA